MCRAEIPEASFERQLDAHSQARLALFKAQQALKPGETMCKCADCEFFEIRDDAPTIWFCQGCDEGECLVCHKRLDPGATADHR